MRGRYAPSPTGPLHAGNLRTALLAWLQARLSDAEFVIRMEDIDTPRTRTGSAKAIMEDLVWMGLDWDEGPTTLNALDPFMQSARTGIYASALTSLREHDLVYPCWCSRKELQEASAPHHQTPVYPGTCAYLSERERERMQNLKQRTPAWRFRVDTYGKVTIHDEIQGPFTQHLRHHVGDFVVLRSDGLWAYQLAVVVDDLTMGITDILRGIDLLDSSPRQVALGMALAGWAGHQTYEAPRFWHVPLMRDASGERMAKRTATEQVDRSQPVEPFIGRLARSLGWDVDDMRAPQLLHQISLDHIRELREAV